jgi:hypothetical protein
LSTKGGAALLVRVSVIFEFFFVGGLLKVPVSLGLEVALGELGLEELLGGG